MDQDYRCAEALLVFNSKIEDDSSLFEEFFIPARMVKVSLLDENGDVVEEVRYNNYEQTVDMAFTKPATAKAYQLVVRVYSYWLVSSEVYSADVELEGMGDCEADEFTADDYGFACEQSPDGASVSQEEAVELVRARPEVQDFISLININGDSEAYIEYDHDECNTYSIHVYEIKDDHTATFNWYSVDMYTGEITTMVDF